MYNMCPYCYYLCPYLSHRMTQERRCMSTPELYDIAKKSDVTETYYISFNFYDKALDGFYHIFGVTGDPKYFIFNATNSNGRKFLLDSGRVCSMNLKGSKKMKEIDIEQLQEESPAPPPKCVCGCQVYSYASNHSAVEGM